MSIKSRQIAADCRDTVQLSGRNLQVQLTAKAAKLLGEAAFQIELDCSGAVLNEVSNRLRLIFGKKFISKKAASCSPRKAPPQQDYSRIKYLNLDGKNLKTLPDYVAEMTSLETAKLARNPKLDFHAVCEVLSKLPSLKQLTFTTDQPVPENIAKLTGLESLTLDGFTTPHRLPESFGQLANLKYLLIMSKSEVILPESFADLPQLAELNVRAESWRMPSRFYRLSKLTHLDLGNCQLTQVPEEMAGMTSVVSLYFTRPDHDYAQILPVVARMTNLKRLDLSSNSVPREIGLCRQIEDLTIYPGGDASPSHLPDQLFGLTQLKTLNLSMNRFDRIPEAIGQLKALEELVFIGAEFETLPDSIGALSNLKLLNISENPTLLALPESIGCLAELTALYLEENPQLKSLPDSCCNLTGLQQFRITDPHLVNNIPPDWTLLLND